ncbi:hypothetical protein RHGRI_003806 [Rhododendron griersonianum]|uniref:Cyclin-dependent kinase inhibitor domain-containing protein n=1 Tax=Rhododendron griersonianum TaxID=479676 RepID=A0AAV6L999_9ERIC|nr:hypothetical protein RHGRI_003806 [Rhododendron griersonianum]
MGKYMRKAKTAADVALMEVAQSSLGVRTRARTLALQRLQKSSPAPATATTVAAGGSYLQLRSRRLEKPPTDHSKRQKQQQQQQQQGPKQTPVLSPNPNSRKSRLGVGSKFVNGEGGNLGIEKLEESFQENKNGDLGGGGGGEASCGENVLEFEGRERYNFDPVNDKPLPGRFEWAKLNP